MTTRKNIKKRVSTVTAVLLAAAMLLGATYAWNDATQHTTNPFSATNGGQEGIEEREVVLNNEFTAPKLWQWPSAADLALDSKAEIKTPNLISVTNQQESTTHVFVRLSLKQYMDMRSIALDDNGKEMDYQDALGNPIMVLLENKNFMTVARAEQLIAQGETQYTGYGVLEVLIGRDSNRVPIFEKYATVGTTRLTDAKPMQKSNLQVVWGSVPRAPRVDGPQTPGEGECAYTPKIMTGASLAGRVDLEAADLVADVDTKLKTLDQHVKIGWNTAEMMTFAQWNAPAGNNGEWVDKWIYDDTKITGSDTDKAQEGWVYWGRPLAIGDTTSDLIEYVATINAEPMTGLLKANKIATMDYFLHSDMEAVSGFSEYAQGLPKTSEVDSLFKPTLPQGLPTDPTVVGRTAFFAAMNTYETESFEDRAEYRKGNSVLRYDWVNEAVKKANPAPVYASDPTKTFSTRDVITPLSDGTFAYEFQAPADVVSGSKTYEFYGWATTRAQAVAGNADAASYDRTQKAFDPQGATLTAPATQRYFAVWKEKT